LPRINEFILEIFSSLTIFTKLIFADCNTLQMIVKIYSSDINEFILEIFSSLTIFALNVFWRIGAFRKILSEDYSP